MLILGIDEAGRGCVIGPMVIAGVVIQSEVSDRLYQLGVRDSKLLSPRRRERLQPEIEAIAEAYLVLEVAPEEIDAAVLDRSLNLNGLEAEGMAAIIRQLRADVTYIDAPGPPLSFQRRLKRLLRRLDGIVPENHADVTYPVVSAASILAKVRRDECIRQLRHQYGDFGSGYPSDPRTQAFLRQWCRDGCMPPIVRREWQSVRRLAQQPLLFGE